MMNSLKKIACILLLINGLTVYAGGPDDWGHFSTARLFVGLTTVLVNFLGGGVPGDGDRDPDFEIFTMGDWTHVLTREDEWLLAAANGNLELLQSLYVAWGEETNQGASQRGRYTSFIDCVNEEGNTALHLATEAGHIHVVEWLLGIRVGILYNHAGLTPLDLVRNKILSNNQLDGESIDHYVIIRRMIVSELLEQFKAAINNKHSIIAQSLLALLQWDADVENFFSETLWDLLIKYKLENEINFFVKYCGWEEVSHKLLKAFQKLNSEWNPVFRVAVCSLINRSCCNHLLGMLNNNVAVDECYRWILMLEKQFQYQFVFDDLMVSAIIGMGDVGLAFIAYYINNETPSRNIKAFILERIIMMNGPNVWQYMLEQCPFFSHLIKDRTCTVFDNIRNLNINHQIDFFKWILEVEGVNRNIYLKHAVEKRCLEGLIKCLNWDINNNDTTILKSVISNNNLPAFILLLGVGYEIELKTFGQFLNIKTGYDEYKQFFNTQKRRTGSYFGLQNRGQLINCDDFVNKIKALFAGDAPNLFLARRIAEYAIEGLECLGAQVLLIEQVVFNKNQMDILEGAIKAIREVLVQHSAGSTKSARKVYVAPDNIGE